MLIFVLSIRKKIFKVWSVEGNNFFRIRLTENILCSLFIHTILGEMYKNFFANSHEKRRCQQNINFTNLFTDTLSTYILPWFGLICFPRQMVSTWNRFTLRYTRNVWIGSASICNGRSHLQLIWIWDKTFGQGTQKFKENKFTWDLYSPFLNALDLTLHFYLVRCLLYYHLSEWT